MLVKLFYIFTFHCSTSCGQATPICGSENCQRQNAEQWDGRAALRQAKIKVIALAHLPTADTDLTCLAELLHLALSFAYA